MKPFILTKDAVQAKYVCIWSVSVKFSAAVLVCDFYFYFFSECIAECLVQGIPVLPPWQWMIGMSSTGSEDVYLTRAYHAVQVLTYILSAFAGHRLYWECINGWLNDFVLQSYFHLAQIIKWLCLSSSADGDVEEDERAERERKEENGDEEALQKARDWDDWKDTHRRGYGNRKNMGWSDFTHSHTHASLQFPQINLPMLPICDMDTADNGTIVVS